MLTALEITANTAPNVQDVDTFYVKSLIFVGPGEKRIDEVILIETRPAVTNTSGEERHHGWCGDTNDWSLWAHGAFATEAEARAAVSQRFGDGTRDAELSGDDAFELGIVGREDYDEALELGDPDAPAGYTVATLLFN